MSRVSRRFLLAGGLSTAAIAVTGLGPFPSLANQAGTSANRIVSVGGTLTEIAFALGAGDRIVGADTTSSWPPEVEQVEKVGYMRRLSAEGVLSLRPDLVLLDGNAGPATAIEQLRAAGVRLAIAPEGTGLDSVVPKIRFVGETLGQATEAEALATRFEEQMGVLQSQLATIEPRPRVLLLISVGRGAPLAAGSETAAEAIIDLARGRNAVVGLTGYKPLSAEAAIAAAPDVLLLPQHVADSAGGADAVLQRPDLAITPAGRNGRVVVMDSLKLLGFGLRTPEAVAELARALHPEHAASIAL